jgi:NAD(P)-dependent dehydrogenase (short-subunit alcohol dehydrogenase family)
MQLESSCIIVSGAAGNLGAAVAVELTRRGARIVCADRSADGLSALAARLPKPAESLFIPGLDLTKFEDAAAMAKAALDRFGSLDGLVNTLGGFATGAVAVDALSGFDMLLSVNAKAALVTSAAVLPAMIARKRGRIVHVAAAAGNKGTAGLAAYSAAKAAVMRIVESIAAEHGADGITANSILPGTIDTPQNRAAMPDADFSKWVTPAAIARVIAFLVSDDAAAVTGAAIPVTGHG